MYIQIDTKNKRVVVTTSCLHQLIQAFSNVSFKRKCFALLPRDATNFENGYHTKRVSLFSIPQRQTQKQLCNVHFANSYRTQNHIGVLIFVDRSVSKHGRSRQLQHNFLCVHLGFEIAPSLLQCLAPPVSVNSASGSVYSRLQHARCTVLTALTSRIRQQTDCFICGSHF